MELDVVFWSRLQFAMTISFHYIFPPLSIGLGALMVFAEGMYLKTGDKSYEAITRFWTRIFAVNFAMGVATGIVMEFQFGTNWATYSRFVGDVFGSALAAEGIFAFFLESGFLAVLVFGWDKVSPRMHFFSTVMVALGSIFSSVWIVVANSWQHTPAGHHLVKDASGFERAEIVDFWAMVFNPSAMHRLGHVILGAFILGAFFVMSISAWYILQKKHVELARKMFTIGLLFGAVTSLAEGASGHAQAQMVARTQPAKLAALEGHYKTEDGPTGMCIFGFPNDKEQRMEQGIYIPYLLTFLVHEDFKTPIPGLDTIPPEDRPSVPIPFVTYRIMAGLGTLFIAMTLFALFLLWRKKLFESKMMMWAFVFVVIGPYIANQAGWIASETARQPWVVTGLLRTKDAVSKAVPAGQVIGSIFLFGLIYLMLFFVWVYVLNDKIQHGPDAPQADKAEDKAVTTPGGGLISAAGSLKGGGGSMTMILRKKKPEDASGNPPAPSEPPKE
jgi:cytochrome bd ubiquinol oxidase subunit I